MQSAPAYTTVAARHTLQRPSTIIPAQAPSNPPKIVWSPEIRQYVQRAFEAGNEIPGIGKEAMEVKLKEVITKAAEAGALQSTDWSSCPLPQHLIQVEQAGVYGAQGGNITNMNPYIPAGVQDGQTLGNRKRKSTEITDFNDSRDSESTPPWKKSNTKGALEDRISGKNKKDKKPKKIEVLRTDTMNRDADILEKRKQRFGYVTPDNSPYYSPRDDTPTANDGPLVGTCQSLEKSYFRLTAPPPAHSVRPLPILEKALNHVRRKWKEEHNYRYACDQLKSLRQDLTVQHIKNELTVKVYEAHARIALEMKDLGEYNQCQTQLRALYRLKLGGNPEEFLAYRILYIIYTCNRTNMNDLLADLTSADKKKPGVQHALQVRSALASANYHKFFRLYDETPFMGGYLLDMFIERERLSAMAVICKTYKPHVSLHFLAKELAFHGADDTEDDPDAGPRQCLEFLCQHGGQELIEQKDGDIRFLSGKGAAIFEAARSKAFRVVDIKGQI